MRDKMMRAFLGLAAAALALSACQQPKQIYVDQGYVRLAAVPGRPAAAYFRLHGGAADATLLSVSTEVAIKSEMHESMGSGGVSSMKPVQQLAVSAGAALRFMPGGRHVMLYDVNPGIVQGKYVPLIFTFADGLRIQYDAPAIAAGAPAPKP